MLTTSKIGRPRRRWALLALALGVALTGAATLHAQQTDQQRAEMLRERPDTDEQRIQDLVIANHILADQGVVDGLGHLSVRSKSNPKHFFLSRSLSAANVTRADIMEFDENSNPVDQKGRALYSERFIHGEIYRARPDVQAVVHSHSEAIIPFTITDVPFRAVIHMASFIGIDPVPVFEIRDADGPNDHMLVTTNHSGAALAKTLGNRNMALLRGHGMVVVADNFPGGPARWAADRAYYAHQNAKILAEGLLLGGGKVKPLNDSESKFIPNSLDRWWEDYSALAEAHSLIKH